MNIELDNDHPLVKFCQRLGLDICVRTSKMGISVFVMANSESEFKDSLVTCVYDAKTLREAEDETWKIFKDAFYLAEK